MAYIHFKATVPYCFKYMSKLIFKHEVAFTVLIHFCTRCPNKIFRSFLLNNSLNSLKNVLSGLHYPTYK
jgi:hypothetical protein